jgi:hypothetical protein
MFFFKSLKFSPLRIRTRFRLADIEAIVTEGVKNYFKCENLRGFDSISLANYS